MKKNIFFFSVNNVIFSIFIYFYLLNLINVNNKSFEFQKYKIKIEF